MKLSIIIPSRNPEALFFKRMRDVVSSHRDWEVIIIDDCSDVPTGQFFLNIDNVNVIRNHRLTGAGESRNIGIRHAVGEYILFLDDDDYTDWRVVENIIDRMSQDSSIDFSFSSYQLQRDAGVPESNDRDNEILKKILGSKSESVILAKDCEGMLCFTNYPWNKVYRAKFLKNEEIRFSNTIVQNDIYAHWKSILSASKIFVTNKVQCIRTNNTKGERIHNISDARRLDVFKALDETYSLILKKNKKTVYALFWIFYLDLIVWISKIVSEDVRREIKRRHTDFIEKIVESTISEKDIENLRSLDFAFGENGRDIYVDRDNLNISVENAEEILSEIKRMNGLVVSLRKENFNLRKELGSKAYRFSQLIVGPYRYILRAFKS